MGRVEGKVALVTGAASGIGRGCAQTLAREGAIVVITDVQDDKGEALAKEIKSAGGQAMFLHHDTTSEADWIRIIGEIEKRHGKLQVLVNNAGIAIGSTSITNFSLEDFRKQQAVNVEGVFLGLKHSIPLMARTGGSIINMSSVAGLKGSSMLPAYCATKGAVLLLSKSVANECAEAKNGIRVNTVHPGLIETPIWESIARARDPGANAPMDLDVLSVAMVPMGVKGVPQDIANGVLWLASEESRYCTGLELVIDGGLTTR
jgi:NAD(P)-dependent dehydrogenase (short-subunit alcohol dehydrogenase family)